jgi:ATP-binding cassette, subfamily B, multidrug efflux pump
MSTFKNLRSLKALNKYLKRYRSLLYWGIIFVIISNCFSVMVAMVVGRMYTGLKHSIENHLDVSKGILLSTGLIIGAALMKGLFLYFTRQTIIVMSRKVEYDLKNDIYAHFQKLSLGYYRRHNTGDLMARISEDVGRVRMYIGPAIMYGMNLSSMIILTVGIMLRANATLTVLSLLPLPFLAVAIYLVNNITYNKGMGIQQQLSALTTFVQEVFSGIRVVKSFAAEENVKEHFKKEVETYRSKTLGLVRVDSFFFPAIVFLMGLSILIVMYAGTTLVVHHKIEAGTVVEFLMYVLQLTWPVASLGFTTSLIQRAAASQMRINELLDAQPEIETGTGKVIQLTGDIAFHNVSFTYPDTGIRALSNINIHIEPGKSLGIIGRTGSGKSTLANLLLRAYDPTAGEIIVDGNDMRSINAGDYRRQIGYVPQDDFLFSESLADNILFSYNKPVDMDMNKAREEMSGLVTKSATIADIFKDVVSFPEGFETMIGERGITLSGGQKQRVGIARAIVNNPQFLILDDCFSAIDTNTEAQILQNLTNVMRGKTSVIISHRVSTVKNASHIIVLDAGAIVEEGNHEQLMDRHGYYYTLYRKQLMEKELYERTSKS